MPTGNLPESGKKLFEKVYNDSKAAGDSEEKAAKKAWGAVKAAGWHKDADGQWVKSKSFAEFSMRIDRASYDKATGERRVRIVASDTDEDNRGDSMSLELFEDFIKHIQSKDPVPVEYQSDFWKSGEPYISVSHYPDGNGKTAPGIIDSTYIDGNYLKSKGKFNDTPLGRRCFEAVCSDLYGDNKDRQDKIRVSIAFLDYMHKHKSSGFLFDRLKSDLPICPECLSEIVSGNGKGKIFLRGQLIHEALTRVPVNTRTSMEVEKSMADKILTRKDDATSIVGDDLANELEKEAELVGKSEALVYRSEEEAPGKAEDECKDPETGEVNPDCMANKRNEMPMTNMKESEVVEESEVLVEEATKTEGGAKYPSSDYLVVEDAKKPSTWHLQVKKHGKPDHGLMGAAKAALTSNHRGNAYEGPDKAKAISKLKKLYSSEKMEWESEVVESEIMTKEEMIEVIKSAVAELMPKPKEEVLSEVVNHPLDATFTAFKSKFDEIINSEVTEEEKLRSVQEPFNSLGTEIVSVIKSSVKQKEVTPEVKAQSDLVKALSDVMNPIAQKLDLVITQLSAPVPERSIPAIPPRRSIPPALVQQAQTVVATPTEDNPTPKLRELIRKTV